MTEKIQSNKNVPRWERISHVETAVTEAIEEPFTIGKQYKSDALGITTNEKTTEIYACVYLYSR